LIAFGTTVYITRGKEPVADRVLLTFNFPEGFKVPEGFAWKTEPRSGHAGAVRAGFRPA
jgi:hypothetical protein